VQDSSKGFVLLLMSQACVSHNQGTVRLPEIEGYPLGPERPGVINYALENDNAGLLITCYGREGGPVAAKK